LIFSAGLWLVGWALRATTVGCADAWLEQGSNAHTLSQKRKAPKGAFVFLAERVGFEPTKGYKPLLVFKTSAFDHSATSPKMCRSRSGAFCSLQASISTKSMLIIDM
jgi:hypothetical protein